MKNLYTRISVLFLFGMLIVTPKSFSQDDDFPEETYTKLRLGFHSHTNFYRQILIGFQNDNATEGIDPGFDAVNLFNLPNDFYFLCGNTELFIQGVGYFNTDNIYPLGLRSTSEGSISINIDAAEYWNPSQEVYIYDAVTDTYFNIKNGTFTANVGVGTFNDRFSLRFSTQSTLGTGTISGDKITVDYIASEKSLSLVNTTSNTATTVSLYSVTGQKAANWDVSKMNQANLSLPLSNLTAGVYIVNVDTPNGAITKKILLK
jgi:type IX secretion system substrate protein